MRQRTNRANSATSAQRPDYYKKMNQDFYFQSQAIVCADFIVDHIITRGANLMYSRYVNQKFPKHIAETYTEYLYKLSSTYVMAYDVHNESTPSHKITEDIEPVTPYIIFSFFLKFYIAKSKNGFLHDRPHKASQKNQSKCER